MRYHSLVPFLLLLFTGCNLPEDDWGVVKTIWNDFPWWSIVWRLIVWTLLGVLVGVIVGIGGSTLLKRWGAYRLPRPRVRYWLTIVIVTLNMIAMPLLFGAIGFLEGLWHAGDVALRHSRVGKEWLPQIAEVGADAVCCVDCFIAEDKLPAWREVQKKRQAVNVPRMLAKLDTVKGGVGDKIVKQAKDRLFEDNPEWEGTAAETVIDWTLPPLIYYLVNRELQSRLAGYGVPDVWNEMRKEACKDGDDLLTHAELTAFLNERVLVPVVLSPLKSWVSNSQWSTLGIVVVWFATPVLALWLTRWIALWWTRRQVRRLCGDKL